MLKKAVVAACAALVMLFATGGAEAEEVCNRQYPVVQGGNTLYLQYCGNRDITQKSGEVTEAHFYIHGVSRTASSYINSMLNDYEGGVAERRRSIAVFAPHFIATKDNGFAMVNEYATAVGGTFNLATTHVNTLYWDNGWSQGDQSQTGTETGGQGSRAFTISSFHVLDRMAATAVANYPNLRRILFQGHSSGGGMMVLYVQFAEVPAGFPEENMMWGAANGGRSPYFGYERPISGPMTAPPVYVTPTSAWCDGEEDYRSGSPDPGSFAGYDDWPRQLVDANGDGYCDDCNTMARETWARIGPEGIKARLQRRKYQRQVGLDDSDPYDDTYSQDCSSHVQGNDRLRRSEAYMEHLNLVVGWEGHVKGNREFLYVPGVGHSGTQLWRSTCGRYFTLGVNANAASPRGGTCAKPYVFYDDFEGDLSKWTATGTGTWATSTQRRVNGAKALRFLGAQSRTITGPSVTVSNPPAQGNAYTIAWGWRISSHLGAGDTIVAQKRVDGGAWTEMARLTGNTDKENEWLYMGNTFTAFTSVQVRFIVTVAAGARKEVWLDELAITHRMGLPEPPGRP